MAWPPQVSGSNIGSNNVTFIGSVPSFIAWGTDGIYSISSNAVILTSVREHRLVEEQRIENGSGLTSVDILIHDGDQAELTCIDDRNLTFPDSGSTIGIIRVLDNGTNLTTTQNFIVIDNAYNAARKAPGERVLLAKKFTVAGPV